MDKPPPDWRQWLRRKIAWLLLFKLAALVTLWLLFFSPAHRVSVDPDVMSQRVAPIGDAPSSRTTLKSRKDDSNDD